MSLGILIYLASMALIYVGERLLAGFETLRWVLLFAGIAGLVGAIGLRAARMRSATDDGLKFGHRRMLDLFGLSLVSLVLYALSTRGCIDMLGFEGEMATRWAGVFGALWPVVWVVATVPLVVLDNALQNSPIVVPKRQAKRALWNGLATAFAIALVFPVNYIGARHFERWDFSYFRTSEAGTATQKIVAQLDEPVKVMIFQPAASEVTQELRAYFAPLEGKNLEIEVLDQAADPALARELRVRDNGFIAFMPKRAPEKGEDSPNERPNVKLVRVGDEMKEARRILRNLDREVQKALLGVSRGELTAYVTTGHGEPSWQGSAGPFEQIKLMKDFLQQMNFKVKKLGLADGLGEKVPDDADLLIIPGPDAGLMPSEVEAIKDYLARGGSLLLAVEPKLEREQLAEFEAPATEDDAVDDLLNHLGLEMPEGVLASEQRIAVMSRNKSDRMNLVTNRFSSHPSTVVLNKRELGLQLVVPVAGHLKEVDKSDAKVTVTVRSLSGTWADLNQNLDYDSDQKEMKKSWPIAAVSEGGEGEQAWRAVVVADATLLTDYPLFRSRGNQQYFYDAVNWLTHQEAASGTVESEEDVRIEHTKEGQAGWFYLTVLGVPMLIFGLGMLRLRIRRKGGLK